MADALGSSFFFGQFLMLQLGVAAALSTELDGLVLEFGVYLADARLRLASPRAKFTVLIASRVCQRTGLLKLRLARTLCMVIYPTTCPKMFSFM